MKTTIYILAALFMMNMSVFAAGFPKIIKVTAFDKTITITINDNTSLLAPVTPKEAFFDDSEPRPAPAIDRLAPIAPKEATFEDTSAGSSLQPPDPLPLLNIAPVTPKEAEFEDSADMQSAETGMLAPSAPLAVSFDE